jgi:hypothetical protein
MTARERAKWVRQRTHELQSKGMSWDAANKQAEAEADDKFNGNNGTES